MYCTFIFRRKSIQIWSSYTRGEHFWKNLKQDQTAILSIARRINNILSVCCACFKIFGYFWWCDRVSRIIITDCIVLYFTAVFILWRMCCVCVCFVLNGAVRRKSVQFSCDISLENLVANIKNKLLKRCDYLKLHLKKVGF